MIKNKVFAIVWVIFAVWYFIRFDNYLAYYLLIATGLLLIYVIVSLIFSKRKIEIKIEMPTGIRKEEIDTVDIVVSNKSIFPVPFVKCRINCLNALTREEKTENICLAVGPRRTSRIPFKIKMNNCGRLQMSLKRILIYDCFGIFASLKKMNCEDWTFVYPKLYSINAEIGIKNIPNSDSVFYSDNRKGYDSGETFGIREYVPGDNIKFIHWKLTNKTDKTLIRELGFPIQNSTLVFLETAKELDGKAPNPTEIDGLFEAFFSVSMALLNNQADHSVSWYDPGKGTVNEYELHTPDELLSIEDEVLSTQIDGSISGIYQYLTEFKECTAAHVVYVTHHFVREDVERLLKNSVVTVLCCGDEEMESFDDENAGLTLVKFYPDTIERDLAQLSV